MKRSYLFAILVLFLLAITLSGCSPAAPAGQEPAAPPAAGVSCSEESSWTSVLECKITHPTNIVGFLNENFGITVGPNGEIHYSGDGQTWPEAENISMCRFCLDIIDENIAWCGGNGGNVRLSNDSGKTWTAVSDIKLDTIHSNIDFIDSTTGWIATNAEIAGTRDGGQTWTKISLPEGAEGVAAICLRTQDIGYLLSRGGMLYATADGGATWSSRDLSLKNYDIIDLQKQPKLISNNPTSADLSFADENNGTIVFTCLTSSHGYQTWCLTTCDGGATWKSELIPKKGFTPSKVFITADGQYLTLSDASGNAVVLKKNA